MANRAREPDQGGTPTRMSGPMAGEELAKDREQEPQQERGRTETAAGGPAGGEWPLRRVVPIAPLLAGAIRRFMADGTLSDLF
jgi:hypothetical protein